MRTNALLPQLLAAAAILTGGAWAEDAESSSTSTSTSTETSTSTAINRPAFTPSELKAPFFEQFTDDWESRWTVSKAKKDDPKSEEDWAYVGEWAVEEPHTYKGLEGDKGLVLKNKAAHHAISAKFPKAIDNKGKTLVVQYEVKLQDGLECGGAYMKLLQNNKKLHAEEFSNSSPYIIMFGPDKCGATNKVHLIIRHKNPKTGEYEEKHLKSPPLAKIESTTQLYTLLLHPNQTYAIQINGAEQKAGSLLEDFAPAFNPPAEIDDPKDTKPDDWVDASRIEDPDAKKPADWDEDAPYEIVDEEATKPADWLEAEPTSVPDPEAEKPEDWDDEEDGDWIPPSVPNPKCNEASGCGPWEKPLKKNPAYKGKWAAPMIDNPAYKGAWAPRKIKNPDFFEDKTPANLEPMGAIGFEIWTMQKDILFDNIYIGHSVADAAAAKAATYDVKAPIEEAERDAAKPKQDPAKPKSPLDLKFTDDPIKYLREKFELFVTVARRDPLEAVRFVPEIPAALGVVLATIIVGLYALLTGGGAAQAADATKKAAAKAKEAAVDAKDEASKAAASGVEKAQEVSKRATRSSTAATGQE